MPRGQMVRNENGTFQKVALVPVVCPICGKINYLYPSEAKRGEIGCSRECGAKATSLYWSNRNRQNPAEIVIKNCEFCGKPFESKDYKNQRFCSHECANAMISSTREYQRGEKNPNWKGGTTNLIKSIRRSPEYQEWRRSVFSRDKYTCVSCKKVGGILHAHHIIPMSEDITKALEVDNGVSLCFECHQKEHPEVHLFWGD